jgi:hypothetical protein
MSEKPKAKLQSPFVHSERPPKPVTTEEPKKEAWPKQQLGAFDWKSAASLRAPKDAGVKAERDWETTDWNEQLPPVSNDARRVAEQIDAVAQKIRKGELSVNGKAPSPETAMAAALEALIRSK